MSTIVDNSINMLPVRHELPNGLSSRTNDRSEFIELATNTMIPIL